MTIDEGDGDVADGTQSGGDAGAGHDPWAPPEHKTSLEKDARPAAPGLPSYPQDQPPASQQPPSVHDQATVTSMPNDGFAAPGYGPPAHGQQPGTVPPQNGWADASVPPPPIAPGGPGAPGQGAPGGYGYPGYPQGYGWPGMQAPPQNGMGVAAMVLGILSCCLFCIYGIVSVILGVLAVIFAVKGKRRADRGEATNRGQAQSGLITGVIGIVLGVATITLLVVAIVIAINDDKNRTDDDDPYYNSAPSVSAPFLAQG